MPEKAVLVGKSSLEDEASFLEYGRQLCGVTPPSVPEEALSTWAKYIGDRPFSKTMVALRWYLDGETAKRSAEICDLASNNAISIAARRHGFSQFHDRTGASIEINRQIAYTSASELNRRLQDKPEEFSSKELGTISTRSLNTVTEHEGKQSRSSAVFIESLAAMTERFIKEGVEIDISISAPKQTPEEIEVFDVGQQAG